MFKTRFLGAALVIAVCMGACTGTKTTTSGTSSIPSKASAKPIETDDWNELIQALVKEDWKKAAKLSYEFLSRTDSKTEQARLRYMHIYSTAGMVGARTLDREKALKQVKEHEGQLITMPSHPVKEKGVFNCIWKAGEDEKVASNTLFTTASDKAAIFIHSFEYVEMAQPVDIYQYSGKTASLGGRLSSIELVGQTISVFKIIVKEGVIEVKQ